MAVPAIHVQVLCPQVLFDEPLCLFAVIVWQGKTKDVVMRLRERVGSMPGWDSLNVVSSSGDIWLQSSELPCWSRRNSARLRTSGP